MGYDLHIVREGGIDLDVWLAVVAADPDLTHEPSQGSGFASWRGLSTVPEPWLDWSDGEVFTKNPDEPLIRKMAELAARLGARVEGDDGEVYRSDGTVASAAVATPRERPGLLSRIVEYFRRPAPTNTPFRIGDRVRCPVRGEGVVVSVDPAAEHGLGRVTVRFSDGRVHQRSLAASGLDPL